MYPYITFTLWRGGEVSFVFSELGKDVFWVLNVGVKEEEEEEEEEAFSGLCG